MTVLNSEATLVVNTYQVDINQAPVSDEELLDNLLMSAIDYDGSDRSSDVVVDDKQQYDYSDPTVGTYTITFSYIGYDGESIEKTAQLVVTAKNVVINAAPFSVDIADAPTSDAQILALGNVTAVDGDGSLITPTITNYGDYDINNPEIGNYTITVSATGINGTKVTQTFVMSVLNPKGILEVQDYTKDIKEAPTTNQELLDNIVVSAIDRDGTDRDSSVRILGLDGYDPSNPALGDYEITFSIANNKDASPERVTKTVTMYVVSESGVIVASDFSADIKAAPSSNQEIIDLMVDSATDRDGSDRLADVSISELEGYDTSNPAVGTYDITFTYTGINGNTIDKVVTMHVVAAEGSIVVSNTSQDILSSPSSEQEIIDLMVVSASDIDGSDRLADVSISELGRYDPANPEVGSYEITFEFEDSNGEIVSSTSSLTITAKNAVISGDDEIIDIDSAPTSEEDLIAIAGLSVTDGDGSAGVPTVSDLDGYDYDNPEAGIYNVVVSYEGINGITVTKTITITIVTETGSLVVKDYETSISNAPNEEQIISNMLVSATDRDGSNVNGDVSISDLGGYDPSNQVAGTYTITFKFIDDDDNTIEETATLTIDAKDSENNETDNDNGSTDSNNQNADDESEISESKDEKSENEKHASIHDTGFNYITYLLTGIIIIVSSYFIRKYYNKHNL